MNLVLERKEKTPLSTIGDLYVNNVFECYTLEDVERTGLKIFGKTAIMKGTYEVVITFSNRFQRLLPLLLSVPNFEGVRIHSGNTADNTEGCILVAQKKGKDQILQSRLAFDKLFKKMQKVAKTEKIFLTIK